MQVHKDPVSVEIIYYNFEHDPLSCVFNKRTMDNVQNCDSYIKILSSKTYNTSKYLSTWRHIA
jgi:hypothetical protein